MRIRHRIPSIFNLSMVDVLCCALGCVILLWLVNLRDARDRAEAVGQTNQLLATTQASLDESTRKATELTARIATLEEQAQAADLLARKLRGERDQHQKDLEAARARVDQLGRQTAADAVRLAKLDKDRAAAISRLTELEMLTREKDRLANAASRRADELAERLLDTEKSAKQLVPLADLVPGLRREVQEYKQKLTSSEMRGQSLEKDLGAAGQRITSLQDSQASLTEQVSRARAAVENRFAGIELAGRRVVFLVDISGSMQYVDSETHAPLKWPGVCAAVVKVLRSLPDLERFQLVLFSDKIVYTLGSEGQWITYDPNTSGDVVLKALTAITPKGNTNMYAALEAAFRYRALGMDTIYFFSDGLPNMGEGLPATTAKTMSETEKATLLGKYIRNKLRSEWNAAKPGAPRVRINAVGFFYESPDLGAFLWALARENDGSFVGMSKP
jgi:von Willebrand factor type A domain